MGNMTQANWGKKRLNFEGPYAMNQAVITLLASILSWCFERTAFSEAEALSAVKQSKRSSAMVHRLLSGMCDAVVHLDGNLCMTQPCPKLSSMLLHGRATSLNTDFVNLIQLSEQDRFVCHMKEEQGFEDEAIFNNDSPACLLHTNLVDVDSTPFPVELFSICVRDGSPCYLIGIKMESDRGHEYGFDSLQHDSFDEKEVGKASTVQGSISRSRDTSDDSSLSSGSSATPILFTPSSSFGISCDAAACLIDPESLDFNILKFNAEFASLGGVSAVGTPFLKWVRDKDVVWMRSHVQDIISQEWYGGDARSGQSHLGRIVLRPPGMSNAMLLEISCTCYLLSSADDEDSDDLDTFQTVASIALPPVLVVLSDVSFRQRARNKQNSNHRSSARALVLKDRNTASSSTIGCVRL
jgi:hypothetical protein